MSRVVQTEADATGEEISSRQIRALFEKQFLGVPEGWRLQGYDLHSEAQRTHGKFRLAANGAEIVLTGEGQGLIEALDRCREPALRRQRRQSSSSTSMRCRRAPKRKRSRP